MISHEGLLVSSFVAFVVVLPAIPSVLSFPCRNVCEDATKRFRVRRFQSVRLFC